MSKYGQYCPIAQSLEILGDRWTLLIIRDMLTGTTQFNDIQRGLPGISRALLAKRLRQLEQAGIVSKQRHESGRQTTSYHLTQSGRDLQGVIGALLEWGVVWAFGDPSPEQLDPLLLMWWMRGRVHTHRLPEERVSVQFEFHGVQRATYWLVLAQEDVNICLTDPGYDIDLLVSTDLAVFFKLWLGRIEYDEAIDRYGLQLDGIPRLVRDFPNWFAWSAAAPVVRATRGRNR